MVARAEDVDVLFGKDAARVEALWVRGIVQAVAFDAIACVDKEDVDALFVGAGAEVRGEGDVVAPVGAVGGSKIEGGRC